MRLNDQSRQGSIVLRVTNDSPQIISVPEITGGARTWVLDAKSFAPAGVFHIDAKANAIRDGNFSITGLAVATLKPIEGTPWVPDAPPPWGGKAPAARRLDTPRFQLISFRVDQGAPTAAAQQASRAYLDAQQATKARRLAAAAAWDAIFASANAASRTSLESAGKAYQAARSAWRSSRKAYAAGPSAGARASLQLATQERLRAKLAFEHAREVVLGSASAEARSAWQSARGEYKAAAARQAQARVALERTR
jgi:hypothetical protein